MTINGHEVMGFDDTTSISIQKGVYTIYGKENCEYCEKAKTLLENEGIEFEYVEVGKGITKEELIRKCSEFNVVPKTVPQIFKVSSTKTVYIGGYTDLVEETI